MGDDNKCGADNYKLMLALVNPHMQFASASTHVCEEITACVQYTHICHTV